MRDDVAIAAAENGYDKIFEMGPQIHHMDSITETVFSDYKFLSAIKTTDDDLMVMWDGGESYSWKTVTYTELSSLTNSSAQRYYPSLCKRTTYTPVHYESVSHVDIDPGPEIEMALVTNVVYDYATNINEFFSLTSDYLDAIMSSPGSDSRLATLSSVSGQLVKNFPDAGWDVTVGNFPNFFGQLVANLTEGIMPSIAGREIYSKAKEQKLKMDALRPSKLNNISIGTIPKFESPHSGMYSGGATSSTSESDWIDPVEVYEYDSEDVTLSEETAAPSMGASPPTTGGGTGGY